MAKQKTVPSGVTRFVFYEILDGDRKKAKARSNRDPAKGGGARDYRFPNQFYDCLCKMLPSTRAYTRRNRKTGQRQNITINQGPIHWTSDQHGPSSKVELWPATLARSAEVRIARVHDIVPLRQIPASDNTRLFLFLVQDEHGVVRAHYQPQDLIESERYNKVIADFIHDCASKTRGRIMGYMDFERGTEYGHGC